MVVWCTPAENAPKRQQFHLAETQKMLENVVKHNEFVYTREKHYTQVIYYYYVTTKKHCEYTTSKEIQKGL